VLNFDNKFIVDELDYDRDELATPHAKLVDLLTKKQHIIYQQIMQSVLTSDVQFYFFFYEYNCTIETFLWKTLFATIRSQGKIVLN
jgi:hypothetical protein